MIPSLIMKKKCIVPMSSLVQHDQTWHIVKNSVKIKKENGEILAIFLKQHIKDKSHISAGRNLIRYKTWSNNRGVAAGRRKKGSGFGKGVKVKSSVVGFMESSHIWPCRKSALYKKHSEKFDEETSRLIKFISDEYYKYAPYNYKKQYVFCDLIKPMKIHDTVFSTVTVNCDWRTRTHVDKGDLQDGLGNLSVFDYTKSDLKKHMYENKKCSWSGGEFLLPEYKVAFEITEGDLLFVDVHEVHCNSEINGVGRVSLVCYARENILKKCFD